MKIKWIRHKNGYVYTAVINAPNDKNVKNLKLNIGAGQVIKLYEGGDLIFFGEVQSARKTSETGTVTYTCYDLLNHLLKSTGVYNFSDTTAERKYICRMDGSKLSVEVKGKKVKNFVLAEEYNITNAEYEETIENMVNVVKIYDEKGAQVGEVKKDKWVEKYGIYQQIYKKEKGINEQAAAKSMLQGVEKRVTVEGINGDLKCIAGNGVEVYDKATGLNGLFWIDSDTHTWENGTHIMSLELNFKNIMDSKEYEENEE